MISSTSFIKRGSGLLSIVFVTMLLAFGLQGCGGSSGGGDQSVTYYTNGYYTGTATLKDIGGLGDMQGMFNGKRFMITNEAIKLVIDGTITSTTQDTFTANVTIYKTDIVTGIVSVVNQTTVTGDIVKESSIKGTIEGTGAYSGTFDLVYALSNNVQATIESVETSNSVWIGSVYAANEYYVAIATDREFWVEGVPTSGTFDNCIPYGQISAIPNSSLYSIRVSIKYCNPYPEVIGDYTGLAALKENGQLLITLTNGMYAVSADYNKPAPL